MPLAGGEPVQLTDGDCEDTGPAWSPDGARLAAQRYPGVLDDPKHTQTAVVVAGGERTVTRFDPVAGRLVRFPEESHELTRSGSPAHRVQRFQIVLDWFDRHLKG